MSMIFLRLACLLAGVLVLVAPPVVLFPGGAIAPDVARAATLLAPLLLASASFFVIGMTGHHIKRSPALGRACALLLLAPFVAGVLTLWNGADPIALWMSGALLSFTLIVSLVLAYLLLQGPSAGRLRAREGRRRREPVLGG